MKLSLRIRMLLVTTSFFLTNLAAASSLQVDTAKSEVTWMGKKILVKSEHDGVLKLKEGALDLEKGQGRFVIDMNSLENRDLSGADKAKLEGHLKSADFFDVKNYPIASFEVNKVEDLGKGNYTLHGNLTIKKTSKAISIPAKVETDGETTKLSSKFEIDRSEFDVRFGSGRFTDIKTLGDHIISDMMEIGVQLVSQ